jgi:hypothetical protein
LWPISGLPIGLKAIGTLLTTIVATEDTVVGRIDLMDQWMLGSLRYRKLVAEEDTVSLWQCIGR